MRESTKTERMHLGDSYELWLNRQGPPPERTRRPKRPELDLYELWLAKRVEKTQRTQAPRKHVAG